MDLQSNQFFATFLFYFIVAAALYFAPGKSILGRWWEAGTSYLERKLDRSNP